MAAADRELALIRLTAHDVPPSLPELRDDLRGQPLRVLGLLEQRRAQDQFRACLGDLAQLAGAAGRRPAIAAASMSADRRP